MKRLSYYGQGLANFVPEPNTGCWLWMGQVRHDGYGRVRVGGAAGRMRVAHRAMYERERGPVPAGLVLDHLCRVRSCVNPAHLEPVTHRTNLCRGAGPTFRVMATGVCMRGHDLRAHGSMFSGKRRCRVCHALNMRALRARRTAARLGKGAA